MEYDGPPPPLRPDKPAYVGNVVLQIEKYNQTETRRNCYSGTFSGTVAGGALNGKPIEVAIAKTATNGRARTIENFADESDISYTAPRGYVAFEHVRRFGEVYVASWANKFSEPDSDLRVGMPVQIAPAFDRDGHLKTFPSNGATMYNARILHTADSISIDSFDAIREAVSESLSKKGAAVLAAVARGGTSGDELQRSTFSVWRGWRSGELVDVEETVKNFLTGPAKSYLLDTIESKGAIDIVPMEAVRINSKTAESIGLEIEAPYRSRVFKRRSRRPCRSRA